MAILNFGRLAAEGKTVIYKETKTNEQPEGWEYWGKRTTTDEVLFVWRKIVPFEEAEQYDLNNERLKLKLS
ncbi:hypothetical protein [Thalassobacillus sp. C254]|uniref:hypothetical protein n=1 Tax=Thalassobacillus sp. C254 TaxID=1225341 RepID=UPI0006D1DA0E|nr:hypothetical protein [Thalassobacillus sp. C254]